MTIGQKVSGAVNGNTLFLSNHPQWDDLSGTPFSSGLSTVTGRLGFNYENGAAFMNANARYPEEPIVVPIQFKHAMVIGAGAEFHAHIHWIQEQSAFPNFLLAYKLTNYGTVVTKETDFTNYTFLTTPSHKFTYPGSGAFAQITEIGADIDVSSATISASFDVVLFRDSANASGLFAGADPVATQVLVKYIDGHVKFNSVGSRQEYVK